MPKDCCINYTKSEFVRAFNIKSEKVFDTQLQKWCEYYDIDINLFRRDGEEGRNFEIQYEIAPLLALVIKTFSDNPFYRTNAATNEITSIKIAQYNKKVIEEIDKLPSFVKNIVQFQPSYLQILQMSYLLPLVAKNFTMLFATIIKFNDELAENMITDLVCQISEWVRNFFLKHRQFEKISKKSDIYNISSEKISALQKELGNNLVSDNNQQRDFKPRFFKKLSDIPPILNCSSDFLVLNSNSDSHYTIDTAILRTFEAFYRDDSSKIDICYGNLAKEIDNKSTSNVMPQECEQLRQQYLDALNREYPDHPRVEEKKLSIKRQAKLIDRIYTPGALGDKRLWVFEQQQARSQNKNIPLNELNESIEDNWQELLNAQYEMKKLYKEIDTNPLFDNIINLVDKAIGQQLISIMDLEKNLR